MIKHSDDGSVTASSERTDIEEVGEEEAPRRRVRRRRPPVRDIAEENPETELDTFKNRRRMAWIALISMLVFTTYLFGWAPLEKIKPLGEVITWFYVAMSSIVGAYMGVSTWAYIRNQTKR